ncbi:hypothetical protein [Rossellomorea vietnamensis]|uniref:hypothetical protein n=1 Tax=Rossellomorea vietnamensis TaxID=218284 RepID=UPI000A4370E7|nr:hypothetical protein [Rossellomorea vietnamensis]
MHFFDKLGGFLAHSCETYVSHAFQLCWKVVLCESDRQTKLAWSGGHSHTGRK